jgi:phenylpropionate dioxygenase-like ring-hydroxylating dioxygenase large terminal subunit
MTRTPAIRDFPGETPLQVMARRGDYEATQMTSLERFPYYTAFPYAWYAACYGDELATGDVRPARLLARDLVLWRSADGTPHVMDAYCPHMGANLALGGRVEDDHLVCPYHWWEWDGDGRNACIPYSSRTNAKARIRTYPTVERNGFVLFWYHPEPSQEPLWDVPQLDEYFTEDWTDFIRADWRVRCPWQELAENGPDYIHLKTVHGAATVPELEDITYDRHRSVIRAKVDFATPRGPQPGRIDTDGWGPGFGLARFSGIIDTIFFNATTPIDWEWTWSAKAYKVRKLGHDEAALARTSRVGEALVADLRKQMAEDNVIFDNKVHVDPPALAEGDGPIVAFRQWARQFYVAGDPVAAGREPVT